MEKQSQAKIFYPLNAVNNGETQNGSAYRKGLKTPCRF